MPWNFCLFCKGEEKVRRENEPLLAKIPESMSSRLMGADCKAGWTSGVFFTEVLMRSELSTSWFAGEGSFLDDRIKRS